MKVVKQKRRIDLFEGTEFKKLNLMKIKYLMFITRDIGGKIAPYVANMKIENEIVALEIGTGASVSILNKKIYDLICFSLSVNLLLISSKLKCYSGELTHPHGKIVCKVT